MVLVFEFAFERANTPDQWPMNTLPKPCSCAVGRSGMAAMRRFQVDASGRSLPPLICGSVTTLASLVASTWWPMTATTPSLPLL